MHGDATMLQRQAAEAKVGSAGEHGVHNLLGRGAANLDVLREFRLIGQGCGQQAGCQCRRRCQAQRACLAARDFFGTGADLT